MVFVEICKFTEVAGKSDKIFANVLNKFRFGTVDENNQDLMKARFIDQSDKN